MKRFFCFCSLVAAFFILCGSFRLPKNAKCTGVYIDEAETPGKYVLVDDVSDSVLSKEYDHILNIYNGVIIYREGNKYGLLDSTGIELIPPTYNYIDGQRDGYAVAYKKGFVEGSYHNGFAFPKELGEAGLIDSRGNVVIPFVYDDLRYSGEDVITGDKVFWYVLDGKGGFIDIAGRRLTRPKYKESWSHNLGYAKVFKDKGCGMVDADGREVIPCRYDDVRYVGKKRFAVKKDGLYSLAAEGGKLLSGFVCDSIENSFRAERAFPVWVMKGDDYAFMDEDGRLITDFDFKVFKYKLGKSGNSLDRGHAVGTFYRAENIIVVDWRENGKEFTIGYAPVPDSLKHYYRERLVPVYDGKRYGYVNDRGKLVVPFRYDKAEIFYEGLAAVQRDGKWGFIDQKGNEAIPPRFDSIECGFSKGKAIIYDKKLCKSYFIDRKGDIIGECQGSLVIIVS